MSPELTPRNNPPVPTRTFYSVHRDKVSATLIVTRTFFMLPPLVATKIPEISSHFPTPACSGRLINQISGSSFQRKSFSSHKCILGGTRKKSPQRLLPIPELYPTHMDFTRGFRQLSEHHPALQHSSVPNFRSTQPFHHCIKAVDQTFVILSDPMNPELLALEYRAVCDCNHTPIPAVRCCPTHLTVAKRSIFSRTQPSIMVWGKALIPLVCITNQQTSNPHQTRHDVHGGNGCRKCGDHTDCR